MDLNINIHETVGGNIFVKELAYDEGFYDKVIPFNKSVSITVLKRVTTLESEIVKAFIHDHSVTDVTNEFSVTYDGRYDITHFIIPTTSWLEIEENKESVSGTIYVSDGKLLYTYTDGILTETTIDDAIVDENLSSEVTAIVEKSVFVLFNLWQCYLNYCKKMLESECSKNNKCADCSDEGTKNRSLIWIFLNALQYYVKFGKLQEAQQLLEELSGCNTLCSNEMFTKLYNCGCG